MRNKLKKKGFWNTLNNQTSFEEILRNVCFYVLVYILLRGVVWRGGGSGSEWGVGERGRCWYKNGVDIWMLMRRITMRISYKSVLMQTNKKSKKKKNNSKNKNTKRNTRRTRTVKKRRIKTRTTNRKKQQEKRRK